MMFEHDVHHDSQYLDDLKNYRNTNFQNKYNEYIIEGFYISAEQIAYIMDYYIEGKKNQSTIE